MKSTTLMTLIGVATLISPALAQGQPPMNGPGGPPPASLASAPVEAMTAELSLTADQQTKVTQIQTQFRRQRESLMPQPNGGPPNPQTVQDSMSRVRALDEQTSTEIQAVLTGAQKSNVPALLTDVDTLRRVGIPAELIGELKLTDTQKSQLQSIAQNSNGFGGRYQGRSVLTDSQQAIVAQFVQQHPRPDFGPQPGGGQGPGSDGAPQPGQ